MKLFGFNITREESKASAPRSVGVGGAQFSALEDLFVDQNARAFQVAAVYRCVNLISDSIAIMPLRYKRWNNALKCYVPFDQNDRNYYEYLLNVRPNARMNGYQFKKNIVVQMLMKGNAIVLPIRDAVGFAKELILVSSDAFVSYNKQDNTYTINDMTNGINKVFDAKEVWHFKNPCSDGGYWGESTISHARRTLSVSEAAEKETLKRFQSGGKYKALLTGSGPESFGTYDTTEMENLADDIEIRLASKDIVATRQGLELKPFSMSSQDMQFIESRKFSLADIARWFGVPLLKLGDGSNSNYKTVDAAQINFYTEALQPICSQIETECKSKTTDRTNWDYTLFDFDEQPLFALDIQTRALSDKNLLETGQATLNDLRRKNGLLPVEGGDILIVSANLKSVEQLKVDQPNDIGG